MEGFRRILFSRSNTILIVTTVLMLAAGVVLGRLSTRVAIPITATTQPSQGPRGWSELKLSTEQREKMDAIWSETRQTMEKTDERRRTLDEDRRQFVQTLLNEEQRKTYDAFVEKNRTDRATLDKEREEAIKGANARTRELLDDEQKKIFDEMTKRMRGGDRGGRGPGGRRPGTMPSGGPDQSGPHGGPPFGQGGPGGPGDWSKDRPK